MALGSRAKSCTPYSCLAVCPNRACPIFLKSIRTVPSMRMRAHIVDNFDTLILRLLVGISSVGFFCYILTAVGNPCASISCFPVTFVRARESRLLFLEAIKPNPFGIGTVSTLPSSLACLSKPTAALFSEHPPPAPVSLPPFRGHISPVSVQTVAAPYPD